MAFDVAKFSEAKFKPRTEKVPVPELKAFFDKKEKPVWTVRNLEGHEIAEASEAVERNKNIAGLIDGLLSSGQKEKVKALKEAAGVTDKTPDDLVKRIAMLRLGSVDPVVDQQLSVRLAKVHPVVFYSLTNKILELTGKGATPGK